jgi:peptidoglycan hydrolase-like protein with peptidoglycan-binding domain
MRAYFVAFVALSVVSAANAQETYQVRNDVPGGYLNLRSGAGVAHSLIDKIPKGQTIKTLECTRSETSEKNGWCKVEWRGKSGWVSSCCISNTASKEIRSIQRALAWLGQYPGPVDGSSGAGTIRSIKAFQEAQGEHGSGELSITTRDKLFGQAAAIEQGFRYSTKIDRRTGVKIGIPFAYVDHEIPTQFGSLFSGAGSKFELTTFRSNGSLQNLYAELIKSHGENIWYKPLRDTWFVLAGSDQSKQRTPDFYIRAEIKAQEIRGFQVRYDPTLSDKVGSLVTVMSSDFEAFASNPISDDGQAEYDSSWHRGSWSGE